MKTKYVILIAVLCFFAGFMTGRKTIAEGKTERLPPITGQSELPVPTDEQVPDQPLLPVVIDTFYIDRIQYIVQKVDTAAIIEDYIKKRTYTLNLFDNEYGKLTIFPEIQYNKLNPVKYEFSPIQKTVIKTPVWMPYVGASYNTLNWASVSAGTFYHNLGIEFIYTTNFSEKAYGLGLKYKF